MYADDTIAAIATPPGPGGVGIIRISGRGCLAVARRVVRTRRPVSAWQSHRLYPVDFVAADGAAMDHGLAVWMKAPHSYTGEDVLELHCHGSPVVLQTMLTHILGCDVRSAEPGEFTKRAFLNGRLDLAQAESVIDLVRAQSQAAAKFAAEQLGGHLSRRLSSLRENLLELKAILEVQIDFSEEEINIAPERLRALIDLPIQVIKDLIHTYKHGSLLRGGARIALVGKPNVGKSSLLNALLGTDRAIVTNIAGTTRDTVEESADFNGIPVILTDTAGLREQTQADVIERLGMARTSLALETAQLRIVVVDGSQSLDAEDHAVFAAVSELPHMVVLNKADLPSLVSNADIESLNQQARIVRASALTLAGLDELRSTAVGLLAADAAPTPGLPSIGNPRHLAALKQTLAALSDAQCSVKESRTADLIAVDVQNALDALGSITGAVTSEDVLDHIFAEFCIGK